MSESYIKIPSELIFNPDISPLELRVLACILFWSGLNLKRYGEAEVKFGAEKLGEKVGIGRESCRKALYKLSNMQLISLKRRGNLINESYGLSSAILPTIETGVQQLRNGGYKAADLLLKDVGNLPKKDVGASSDLPLNEAGSLHLNDVGNLPILNPDLPLKDADLPLKDAGHIDDRFKIKLNLNKIRRAQAGAPARTRERTHNETGDVAPVRSKPKEESARDVMAASLAANDADQSLLRDMQAEFTDIFADLSLSKAGNTYILRKKGKYALIEDVRLREVVYWLSKRGLDARIMDTQTRVLGETLLEVA